MWVVNAYMLTFGGFLLLGGRLGDLYGHRRFFLLGLILFTAASLGCGSGADPAMLVAARAIQGIGGAVVTAVALSLIMDLFTETGERAKAMGIYGFVCSAGGSIGVLLGGLLTTTLNWHWIFLVNLPIGAGVYFACLRLLPQLPGTATGNRLDVVGCDHDHRLVDAGRLRHRQWPRGGLALDTDHRDPRGRGRAARRLPRHRVARAGPADAAGLFRLRNVATANVAAVLWAAAMFAWFFISALYLQLVLGYNAMQVGLSFLPANIIMAAFSLGLSARIVMKFGWRRPLAFGLLCAGAGLALFAHAPLDGYFWIDVLPGMALLGIGAGIAFNPLLLGAMSDVSPGDSGLASGVVNTAFMMGGSLGLAVLASLAAGQTDSALAQGAAETAALNAGYRLAFLVGAMCAAAAGIIGGAFMRTRAAVAAH